MGNEGGVEEETQSDRAFEKWVSNFGEDYVVDSGFRKF